MSEYLQSGQHPDADQIGAFVEHALPAHEREQIFNHLAVCPECRAVVALSLPSVEEPAQSLAAATRRPWWSGWTLAWPAAAALAALTVLVLYLHRAAVVPSAPASTQIASSHVPASPTAQEQSPAFFAKPALGGSQAQPAGVNRAASKDAAGLTQKQIPETGTISAQFIAPPQMQDRKVSSLDEVARAPVNLPAGSPGQNLRFNAAPRVVASGGASSGVAGGLATAPSAAAEGRLSQPAPPKPLETALVPEVPASAPIVITTPGPGSAAVEVTSAAPIATASYDAAKMTLAAEEAQVTELKHSLPSRLPVLSMVEQAHLVVAIDTSNAVFLSRDDGRHWKAIRAQWQGRAVRTALVGSPAEGRAGFGHDKEAGAVAMQAAGTESAGNRNEAALAQLRSLSVLPSGSLAGTVTDMSGAVIPGATVAVTDTAANAVRTARTDQSGQYHVDGLAPGTYRVDARSPGFRTETLAAVGIASGARNVANLSLAVGAASQTVTVASAPLIETGTVGALATEIPASKKEKAKPAAPGRTTPVFEIVTDSGERWTSADGVTWKRM
jgi:hypothetical protein